MGNESSSPTKSKNESGIVVVARPDSQVSLWTRVILTTFTLQDCNYSFLDLHSCTV